MSFHIYLVSLFVFHLQYLPNDYNYDGFTLVRPGQIQNMMKNCDKQKYSLGNARYVIIYFLSITKYIMRAIQYSILLTKVSFLDLEDQQPNPMFFQVPCIFTYYAMFLHGPCTSFSS